MAKTIIKVAGMHCPSCEMLIADVLGDESVKAKADYKKGEVAVDFDEKKITPDKIKKLIEKDAGYKVVG
jgi:copper chaperone CopZ